MNKSFITSGSGLVLRYLQKIGLHANANYPLVFSLHEIPCPNYCVWLGVGNVGREDECHRFVFYIFSLLYAKGIVIRNCSIIEEN